MPRDFQREFQMLTKLNFMTDETLLEIKEQYLRKYVESTPLIYNCLQKDLKLFKMTIKTQATVNIQDDLLKPLIQKSLTNARKGDRLLKMREISSAVSILRERLHNILHKHLNMEKLTARLRSVHLKIDRVTCLLYGFLHLFQHYPQNSHSETRDEPKQRVAIGES